MRSKLMACMSATSSALYRTLSILQTVLVKSLPRSKSLEGQSRQPGASGAYWRPTLTHHTKLFVSKPLEYKLLRPGAPARLPNGVSHRQARRSDARRSPVAAAATSQPACAWPVRAVTCCGLQFHPPCPDSRTAAAGARAPAAHMPSCQIHHSDYIASIISTAG